MGIIGLASSSEPLVDILVAQELGPVLFNPIKYAIRSAVSAGVPAETIVLLLLLPAVAAFIAGARHVIGVRGFGIFLPAALSVVFLAVGPIVGIAMFLLIVGVSTLTRVTFKRNKVKLQYLPKMAMTLLFVVVAVLGLLFLAPLIRRPDLINVSIFPILILVLLAEDFTKVQTGKSARVAINMTTETLILALVSFIFLTLPAIQVFAILHPELLLLGVLIFDLIIGKYVGLRFVEYWRFRKLIKD